MTSNIPRTIVAITQILQLFLQLIGKNRTRKGYFVTPKIHPKRTSRRLEVTKPGKACDVSHLIWIERRRRVMVRDRRDEG